MWSASGVQVVAKLLSSYDQAITKLSPIGHQLTMKQGRVIGGENLKLKWPTQSPTASKTDPNKPQPENWRKTFSELLLSSSGCPPLWFETLCFLSLEAWAGRESQRWRRDRRPCGETPPVESWTLHPEHQKPLLETAERIFISAGIGAFAFPLTPLQRCIWGNQAQHNQSCREWRPVEIGNIGCCLKENKFIFY